MGALVGGLLVFYSMKDIELVDVLFRYMYDNGELLHYKIPLLEAGVDEDEINIQLLQKLNSLLKASGFAEVTNKKIENHPSGFKLNNEGVNMMLLFGSYENFLKEKQKEKTEITDEKEMERKNLDLDIKSKEWNLKTKWIFFVFAISGWIVSLLQFILSKLK